MCCVMKCDLGDWFHKSKLSINCNRDCVCLENRNEWGWQMIYLAMVGE